MFKDPLKRYSRYDNFRRLAGKLNIILCRTDPPETSQKYAHVTIPTKILLSKGVSGKTFPDTEKKKKQQQQNKQTNLRLFLTGLPMATQKQMTDMHNASVFKKAPKLRRRSSLQRSKSMR